MPRARDPIYREHFKTVAISEWRCNICTGRAGRRTRTRQKAIHHSKKHHPNVGATHLENFTTVEFSKWRCNICVGSRGGKGRTMTRKQAMFHEVTKGHSSKVAATFFRNPGIFRLSMQKGDLKWHCQICKGGGAMTVKKAVAHEVHCHGGGNGGDATSMDRNGTVFERDDDDNDNNDDDNNNDDNDSDDNDDSDDDSDNSASCNGKEVDKLLSSQWWADSSARNVASRCEGPEAAEWDLEARAEHNDGDNDDDNKTATMMP
ncbi:hypothetical protein EDB92DRAFT_1635822 [Lactarius akahatsu]|uniref:Uncharacterized protein n=1 Tax=Lactarius akahatsu TaxID=416441 RepID=A0AAD4LBY3_9AGAM|nr:hypothetical protein EDB92DRAFT_1635822 [Lactarius akahatsu]